MPPWCPDAWLRAWRFAAYAHRGQLVPDTELPYVVHVGAVAMEVATAIAGRVELGDPVEQPDFAITVALVHDAVEDTLVSLEELARSFGPDVAEAVASLSKNPRVGDKAAQMRDSLARIRARPREVWMVKLADRITNLQPPPRSWDGEKIRRYRDEAIEIHAQLGEACPVLGPRLLAKIADYGQFIR